MTEITRDLAPGSVDLRLRGLDPEFVVTAPPVQEPYGQPELPETAASEPRAVAPPAAADADEGGTARINFRLPAPLKARVEEAAGQEGLSVNAWLVRAVASALEPGPPAARPAAAPAMRASRATRGGSARAGRDGCRAAYGAGGFGPSPKGRGPARPCTDARHRLPLAP